MVKSQKVVRGATWESYTCYLKQRSSMVKLLNLWKGPSISGKMIGPGEYLATFFFPFPSQKPRVAAFSSKICALKLERIWNKLNGSHPLNLQKIEKIDRFHSRYSHPSSDQNLPHVVLPSKWPNPECLVPFHLCPTKWNRKSNFKNIEIIHEISHEIQHEINLWSHEIPSASLFISPLVRSRGRRRSRSG